MTQLPDGEREVEVAASGIRQTLANFVGGFCLLGAGYNLLILLPAFQLGPEGPFLQVQMAASLWLVAAMTSFGVGRLEHIGRAVDKANRPK